MQIWGWQREYFDARHKVTKWCITPPAKQYVDPEDPWPVE